MNVKKVSMEARSRKHKDRCASSQSCNGFCPFMDHSSGDSVSKDQTHTQCSLTLLGIRWFRLWLGPILSLSRVQVLILAAVN